MRSRHGGATRASGRRDRFLDRERRCGCNGQFQTTEARLAQEPGLTLGSVCGLIKPVDAHIDDETVTALDAHLDMHALAIGEDNGKNRGNSKSQGRWHAVVTYKQPEKGLATGVRREIFFSATLETKSCSRSRTKIRPWHLGNEKKADGINHD